MKSAPADAASKHLYWAGYDDGTIGRAKSDGSGVDQSRVTGAPYNCGLGIG